VLGNSLIFDNGTNVGIGTTSPQTLLHIKGTPETATILRFSPTSSTTIFSQVVGNNGDLILSADPNNAEGSTSMKFNVDASERMRLNSSQGLVMADGMQVLTTGGYYRLRTSAGATTGLFIQKNTWAGFGDASPTIAAETGYGISFFTNGNNTERLNITTGGAICINTTAPIAAGRFNIVDDCNSTTPIEIKDTAASNSGAFFVRFVNNNNVVCGSIAHQTSTTTQYNTSSDYRLKKDLKDYNGLDVVSKIKTYDFEWIEDGKRMYGVLAHELAEIIPYAVNGEKDGEQMQGADYSKIVPVLVKAIQEQQKQIDSLKQLVK
jgi:hypothetical protein